MTLDQKLTVIETDLRQWGLPKHVLGGSRCLVDTPDACQTELAPENVERVHSLYRTIDLVQKGEPLNMVSDESILAARRFFDVRSKPQMVDAVGREELRRRLWNEDSSGHFDSALRFLRNEEYAPAELEFQVALNISPKFLLAYTHLGAMLTEIGEARRGRDVLERSAKEIGLTCRHAIVLALCYRELRCFHDSLQMVRLSVTMGMWDFEMAQLLDAAEASVA
jgi:hypothetical protein